MKCYIGIDIGLSGAIATLESRDGEQRVEIVPMPTVGTKKKRVDVTELYWLFEALCTATRHVVIEDIAPMSKMGRPSCMELGRQVGYIVGIMVATGTPHTIVRPPTWQKAMFSGVSRDDTKLASIVIAKRLFPGVSLRRTDKCRRDDHNMADALLLAEWGRRTL